VATIRRLLEPSEREIGELAEVLLDCVSGGASVGFMHPLEPSNAREFWRHAADEVRRERRVLLVAEDETGVVGTVQLLLDLPENQPHRADVSKLLVHRRARRQGIGEALMRAADEAARSFGRSLLVLDTASGQAERIYERLGWIRVGTVPGFALMPDGAPCDTVFFYRTLVARVAKVV
jgi:GNAT superfamily N-acetyltransferase